MARKNIMQDVLPPEKKSIRRIPVSRVVKKTFKTPEQDIREEEIIRVPVREPKREIAIEPEKEESFEREPAPVEQPREFGYENKKSWKTKIFILAGIILLVFVVVTSLMTYFAKAEIVIDIKKESADLNEIFSASRTSEVDKVTFQTITLTGDEQVSVPSNGAEKVEKKASGEIIIFNKTAEPVTLVKNTRFEKSDGLIYRIGEPIVIPGKTTKDSIATPGSITITVTADQAGEKYNSELADFTIPGFKSNVVKYENVFARSKTSISGGFSGTIGKVSESLSLQAIEKLRTSIKSRLLKDVSSQVPEGSIFYEKGLLMVYETLNPSSVLSSTTAVLGERGTSYGILFDRNELKLAIMKSLKLSVDASKVDIANLDKLDFTLIQENEFAPETGNSFSFRLTGKVEIVWKLDRQKILSEIAGKSKNNLKDIWASHPEIVSAQAKMSPFWVNSIPSKLSNIAIIISGNSR